ncbi:MAG TPA: polyribonucleotide nucleotidyltransferase [Holosporales bacterium]|nr:polyribonucleotide nucleotidyltransferase [Holosporales bacterium]
MFKAHKQEIEWGGRTLTLETGKVARQSDGAVIVTYGKTSVLCTAVSAKKAAPGVDFFPLAVHHVEKYYAAGRIPGGFFKREGRPTEREILISRLIDRPIRPLFPDNFRNETQVICNLLSHDMENDPDIIALIGASAALSIAGVPFAGPVAAAKIALDSEGSFILNPTVAQAKESNLDLVVAGTTEGVLMVESEASELSEDLMLDAVMFAHKGFQPVIEAINKLKADAGKEAWVLEDTSKEDGDVFAAVQKSAEKAMRAAYQVRDKQERVGQLNDLRSTTLEAVIDADSDVFTEARALAQFKKLEKKVVRGDMIKTKTRIDGRDLETVREIKCEVNVVPQVHGSALFTRGETQALVITTLGTSSDEQIIDSIDGEYRECFMLHYNFPPYSVGEARRFGPPGRREIGHGKLAWRALNPVIPTKEEFPYTLRVVSEITESNGSSSMATVCGTSLSLMDAGVTMHKPVAGIAMGLIKEEDDFIVLSDILGDEDHLGDMDFKVAGTKDGITSLQMDIKVTSITRDIMKQALKQALDARIHILGEMAHALTDARTEVSDNAPKMHKMQIKKEKIRDLIGPGGKMIRQICEEADVKIDISEEGEVEVAGNSAEAIDKAISMINSVCLDPEVGEKHHGKVIKLMDFGAIVSFMGDKTGLVHISQLKNERVEQVSDVVKEGDSVWVKILEVDARGKVRLSMKSLDQETGEDVKPEKKA